VRLSRCLVTYSIRHMLDLGYRNMYSVEMKLNCGRAVLMELTAYRIHRITLIFLVLTTAGQKYAPYLSYWRSNARRAYKIRQTNRSVYISGLFAEIVAPGPPPLPPKMRQIIIRTRLLNVCVQKVRTHTHQKFMCVCVRACVSTYVCELRIEKNPKGRTRPKY